ncbi:MAG: peptidylprolyl isomerase [Acidimicrobiia bacterium]|nr:peptidylprolyl isomerase [Acidimicrobiia bacterium]
MKRILLLVLALAVVASACSGGSVVATVNGVEIHSGDVEALIAGDLSTVPQDLYAQLIYTLIVHEVVVKAAEDEFGVTVDQAQLDEQIAALTSQIELSGGTLEEAAAQQGLSLDAVPLIIQEDLTEQAVGDALTASEPDPSEEDVLAAYNSALQSLTEVCAGHILVATEEEAQGALDRIAAGEAFEAVATELSTDTVSGEAGGDLGCAAASTYVPEFAIAAIEAELGVPTAPVQSEFGYHVILVRERTETSLEEVRGDIVASLREGAKNTLLSDWMLVVIGGADVTVAEEYGTWELEPFPTVVPPAQ